MTLHQIVCEKNRNTHVIYSFANQDILLINIYTEHIDAWSCVWGGVRQIENKNKLSLTLKRLIQPWPV